MRITGNPIRGIRLGRDQRAESRQQRLFDLQRLVFEYLSGFGLSYHLALELYNNSKKSHSKIRDAQAESLEALEWIIQRGCDWSGLYSFWGTKYYFLLQFSGLASQLSLHICKCI